MTSRRLLTRPQSVGRREARRAGSVATTVSWKCICMLHSLGLPDNVAIWLAYACHGRQFLKPCIARPQTNSQCQQPLRESNSRMVTVVCQLQRQLCCDRIRTVNQSTPGVFLTCQSWTGRSPIVRATATPEYVDLNLTRLSVCRSKDQP